MLLKMMVLIILVVADSIVTMVNHDCMSMMNMKILACHYSNRDSKGGEL